jgi:hypothetical protein
MLPSVILGVESRPSTSKAQSNVSECYEMLQSRSAAVEATTRSEIPFTETLSFVGTSFQFPRFVLGSYEEDGNEET